MIDIVIVNWNSGDYLRKCLESIFHSENEFQVSNVFVIDNNSTDGSLSIVSAHAKLKIIQNCQNLGFAKACNQGFKQCKSKYVLLLNPDTQLLSHTLKDCKSFLDCHTEVDILGCQLLDDNGKITQSCSRFPSPLGFFRDATGLSKLAPKIFTPGIVMTDWDHESSRVVDQLMGAFMFMRTSIFEKLGYFDERFFVYYEEVDFSKRLATEGGKSFYNSEIKAIHSGEGTTHSVKAFRLFLSLQSRMSYAEKHFSKVGYLITWATTFLIEPFTRAIFFLIKGKFSDAKEVFKGYRMLLTK